MTEINSTSQEPTDNTFKDNNEKYQNSSKKYVILGTTYMPRHSSISNTDNKDKVDDFNNGENYTPEEQCIRDLYHAGFLNQWFPGRKDLTKFEMGILSDIYSKINFTYRTRFSPIERAVDGPSPINFQLMFRENPLNLLENVLTNPDCFNTDIGWGCMIRTGQSLLANTIQRIQLTRSFRITDELNDKYVVSLFKDTPNAPYSLHNFVQTGVNLSNMKPGQWFGPSATSRSIQNLIQEYPQCGIDNCIVSVSSGDIPKEEIDEIYFREMTSKTLILLGIKLGIDSVNELYWKDILTFFDQNFTVGIAGGRPSSSLYFFGYEQEDNDKYKESHLLYFDPHTSQPSLDDDDYKTCHSMNYGKLQLKDMDPSMLVGIFLENLDDWLQLQQFANDSKMFNIISTNMNVSTFDETNLDIESLQSEEDELEEEGEITNLSNDRGCIINAQPKLNPEDKNDIDENYDDLAIIQRRRQTVTSITNDYIDVGSLAYHTPESLNETFENIQCKKQKIMIFDQDKSFEKMKDGDIEVEKVLVESTPVEPSGMV